MLAWMWTSGGAATQDDSVRSLRHHKDRLYSSWRAQTVPGRVQDPWKIKVAHRRCELMALKDKASF